MKTLKVYSKGGLVILKPDSALAYVYDAGDVLSASNNSTISTGIDITDTTTSQVIFSAVDYRAIEDESGTDLNSSRAAVVTDLNAIFEKKVLDDFVVKDETSALSGTTKIRHKAGSGGADRDEGGTLELDLHSASIGLYGSDLKITETDLSNTSGKAQAYGRLQFYLEDTNTPVQAMDFTRSNAFGTVANIYSSDLTITGDVTFSGASGTVTFSGDTSGIAYTDISGTPTIPTNVSDLTNDSGFITAANSLEGIYLDIVTRTSAYGNGSFEGWHVFYGSGTLSTGKIYSYGASGWVAIDNSAEATTKGLLGFAKGTSPTTDGLVTSGILGSSAFSSFSAGDILYVGSSGALSATAPTTSGRFVRVVGYALGSNNIYLNPSPDYIELS